jgi:quercetin dioxygenase-like cupin family protein
MNGAPGVEFSRGTGGSPVRLQGGGMQKTSVAVVGLFVVSGAVVAAQAPADQKPAKAQHVMMTGSDLKWGAGPPALPAGVQAAVLDGDPGNAGLFVIRLKMPDGYAVPPHWHPRDEHVTVVSGTLNVGMGDKLDESSMHAMTAGSYVKMPAKSSHFVRAKGTVVIQVMAMGPFEVTYVNPNDDPRKKSSSGQ